jgi:hypothetical protein
MVLLYIIITIVQIESLATTIESRGRRFAAYPLSHYQKLRSLMVRSSEEVKKFKVKKEFQMDFEFESDHHHVKTNTFVQNIITKKTKHKK